MNCASFFAGVGGIDLGFAQAGFATIYANELDKFAVKTLEQNFNFPIDHRDIHDVKTDEIPDFDILLAGFPCQAFSVAGYRQGFDDKKGRGNLFFELERIFSSKKPSVIFLENVKNLVGHDHGNTFKVIVETLNSHGYHIKHQVLNASEYGNIPQNRERIYIVGFLDKNAFAKFKFPKPIKRQTNIADMLEAEENIDPKFYYTDKTPFFRQLVEEIKDANTLYQWRRQYVRANKNQVCPTLTANMGTGGHNVPLLNVQGLPSTIRKLTPQECFNFQGFPKYFNLPSTTSNANLYKQAGNSVVVPVIARIAEQIKLALQN
ncbi:type II methylase [Moraxella macacae 0408225]|uniref:Cytosine-specific methyltransferase n=1 Tax=Moraxella macacae 0408225 TaxID=1230338 RepID=L2FAF0_9GAMM|nr:DNA cytosine methyltransferase [Moraxella macacae]ELA09731.1 type II methylase [Moraxella macacae 0408225]